MWRVVVTGMGCISALGRDVDEFQNALTKGVSGIGPLTQCPTERTSCKVAAEVPGYDPQEWFTAQEAQRLDRFAQFGVIAGREAIRNAGITFDRELGLRSAIVMGSGIGGLQTLEAGYQRLYIQGHNKVYPLSVPKVMLNSGVSALSAEFGILGPGLHQYLACTIEHGLDVGETGLRVQVVGREPLRVLRGVGQDRLGQRPDTGLACDLRLGAALRLVRQVEILQPLLGVGGLDLRGKLARQLSLLLDAPEDGRPPILELPQVAEAVLQLAQLHVVQSPRRFLAVTGDEGHCRSLIK
jgi:hypothetical protein